MLSLLYSVAYAQDNYMLKGYVKGMSAMQSTGDDEPMMIENTIYNRLDFNWYLNDNFTLTAGLRNRIVAGNNVSQIPDYSNYISRDQGYMNLNWLWVDKNSWLGISQIDRLMFDYTVGNLQITVGRQRINWGQSYVWNPNDLFNTYSYFDFDYEEKPGSDAVRLQYYIGESGKIESSTSINSDNKITSALLYRFNTGGYDLQFLGGVFTETDYVIGAGWSGSIAGGGFNGELTYYHPIENFADSTGNLTAAIHYDYTFSNSLNLQLEMLYNGFGADDMGSGLGGVLFMDLSPKSLFITKYAFFTSAGYSISPLVYASLSGMYGPEGSFLYVGPMLTYSMSDTMELAAIGQYFSMEEIHEDVPNEGSAIFVRLKWSF
ncbi:MAG: hypothetical protein ABFR62_03170 [Bacteroidota bacterium]